MVQNNSRAISKVFINEHLRIFILPPLRISDTFNTTAVLVSLRKLLLKRKSRDKNNFKKKLTEQNTLFMTYYSFVRSFVHSVIYSLISIYLFVKLLQWRGVSDTGDDDQAY